MKPVAVPRTAFRSSISRDLKASSMISSISSLNSMISGSRMKPGFMRKSIVPMRAPQSLKKFNGVPDGYVTPIVSTANA